MWINLPRSTGATLLALWCHPIHYPAFEMKFEVKNNQTNKTEFYVKWSKPSQFKCQCFSTLNETRLCLSLAKLSCHAIRSISKNWHKLGASGSRNENDFRVAFSNFICSLKVCGHFLFFFFSNNSAVFFEFPNKDCIDFVVWRVPYFNSFRMSPAYLKKKKQTIYRRPLIF